MTGIPVTINVLANDTGFMATIDRTSVSTTGFLQPSHGTVTVNANGTLTYKPVAGYTGNDTLVYQVCSTPAVVCDWAYVIIKISACPSPAKKNLIEGQVFWDISKDGVNNDGGTGIYPAKVYLYVDGNANSAIDDGELSDSVSVDPTGYYQFNAYPQKTIKDDFDDGASSSCGSGSDGSNAWLSNWTDTNDQSTGYCNTAKSAANTDVEVVKDAGYNYGLRIKDNNVSAVRSFNISGVTDAYLSFAYRKKGTAWAAGEADSVQISTNGTNYKTLYTIAGPGQDATYNTVSNINILPYASATTYLRILTNNSVDDADTLYIDNISIKYQKYNQCYILKVDTTSASLPASSYFTTPKQYAACATSAGTCMSPYDFGIAKNSVTISGTLYNDANGLADGLVNGTAFDNPSGTTMYAYLLDSLGNVAFKDTLNNGNGTFQFTRADVNTLYSIVISKQNVSVGADLPSATLPWKWSSVGENYGTNNVAGSGNEAGTPNSIIDVRTGTSNVTSIKFGIQLPNAGADKAACLNYGSNTVTMAASTTPGTWTAKYDNPGTATINSPTSTTTTITNFSDGGTYNFIWTNADGGADTASVVITDPSAGADFSWCGGGAATLNGNYTSGTWTAKSGNPAGGTLGSTVNGTATVTYTNSSTGSYYYIYTVNTCPDTVKLTLTPKPSAGSASGLLYECANANGYLGQLTATNPSPNSGQWYIASGPGTITSPTSYQSNIASLSKTGVATIAKWVITDSYGCKDTVSATITPPAMDTSMISKYSNSFCITCPVSNGNMLNYYDANGKLLASVADSADGTSLGQTNFCAALNYNVTGNPDADDVQSLDTWIDGAGHVPQPYLPRAWNINTTTDAPMTVTLYLTDQEVAALQGATLNNGNYYYFDTAPELLVAAYPNNADTLVPAGSPNGLVLHPIFERTEDGYWRVSFRISQSATFYLYPTFWQGSPLPVELLFFEAAPDNDAIRLAWGTASEHNNMKFEIERSLDAEHFTKIGEVAGAGNATGARSYKYYDRDVQAGVVYYYRLRQVDTDGKYTYSKIRRAMIEGDGTSDKLSISQFMPNPAARSSKVMVHSGKAMEMQLRVISIDGNVVMEQSNGVEQGENEISIDISSLAKGTYVVQFNSMDGTEIRKLIKID
jgi:hypothetical protein